MNKRIWFYISIVLFVFLLILLGAVLNYSCVILDQGNANLQVYMEMVPENNFYANKACIPDAKTAAKVGSAIIDNMCNKNGFHFGFITVEYDGTNRLWEVNKAYGLFNQGGFVIIKQDTGEIIRALLNK